MTDQQIIALYHARSEQAVRETYDRYGAYCLSISFQILKNREDAEECLSDMLQKCWEVIPDNPPLHFRAYLTTMIRNISISRYRKNRPQWNDVCLDTLCPVKAVSAGSMDDRVCDALLIKDCFSKLSASQTPGNWELFRRRYLEGQDIQSLAAAFGLSESCVKVRLLRMRRALRLHLESCGMAVS